MLNHVEIQGKIGGGTVRAENQTSFFIYHKRGFGDKTDRFLCTVEGDRQRLLDGANEGRAVIVAGRLRACRVCSYEIVCETVDYVDGGGANAD